jgi:hypothetical protein
MFPVFIYDIPKQKQIAFITNDSFLPVVTLPGTWADISWLTLMPSADDASLGT